MNKIEQVKYRELKIIIPEYLYNEVMQLCRKLYGKRNYKLKCYEAIIYEFLNKHTPLIIEKGEPLTGKVKKKQVNQEHIPATIRTTEL